MDRNPLYRPPKPLLDGEDDDEIAPWQAERLAREAMHSDPAPVDQARLVSARVQEVQDVSSLGQGRRHDFHSGTGGDNSLGLTASFTGGDNVPALQTSGDNSLGLTPSLVPPEVEARLVEQARLAAHYDRVRSGKFTLDLDFALVHVNRKGFHPGKPRRGRDGATYPSAAPSDWARFFIRIKLNSEHWKVNLAPPEIWSLQYGDPVGKRRSRVAGPVAYYREVIETYLGQADLEVPPHEGRVWLGLLWRGRPGDPSFSRGPRYPESDVTWIVLYTDDNLKPVRIEVACILPSWHDDAAGDQGVMVEVPLTERKTKRQIRREKSGKPDGQDAAMKWVWFKSGYVMTEEDKAVVSPGGKNSVGDDED
jgi:hypothetical protein